MMSNKDKIIKKLKCIYQYSTWTESIIVHGNTYDVKFNELIRYIYGRYDPNESDESRFDFLETRYHVTSIGENSISFTYRNGLRLMINHFKHQNQYIDDNDYYDIKNEIQSDIASDDISHNVLYTPTSSSGLYVSTNGSNVMSISSNGNMSINAGQLNFPTTTSYNLAPNQSFELYSDNQPTVTTEVDSDGRYVIKIEN